MRRDDEHTGCQITLKMDEKETIWKTEQWDCDATQLIQAFAGLMISQTFLPITVWRCMKEEAIDQLEFIDVDALREEIVELKEDKAYLKETIAKLEAKLRDASKEEEKKVPFLTLAEEVVKAGPYTDHYEEYVPREEECLKEEVCPEDESEVEEGRTIRD